MKRAKNEALISERRIEQMRLRKLRCQQWAARHEMRKRQSRWLVVIALVSEKIWKEQWKKRDYKNKEERDT